LSQSGGKTERKCPYSQAYGGLDVQKILKSFLFGIKLSASVSERKINTFMVGKKKSVKIKYANAFRHAYR